MKITVELNRPKINKRWLITALVVVAAGAGCYLWGANSINARAVVQSYLAELPVSVSKAMHAGEAVMLVGNTTMTASWESLCDSVLNSCEIILQNQEETP